MTPKSKFIKMSKCEQRGYQLKNSLTEAPETEIEPSIVTKHIGQESNDTKPKVQNCE